MGTKYVIFLDICTVLQGIQFVKKCLRNTKHMKSRRSADSVYLLSLNLIVLYVCVWYTHEVVLCMSTTGTKR